MKPRRGALCIELTALAADGSAPDWVQLIPAGSKVTGRDGRWWMMSDPGAVVSASLSDRDNLPIDWNHSTENRAPYGEDAPAAGWIEELAVRQGSIWGRVEWTARGRQSVESKEYRYLSPAFRFDTASMEIRSLTSVGLTNSPNLDLGALNHEERENDMEFLKSICQALGLTEASTEEQVLDKVKALKTDLETATNRAANPSLDKFVPWTDYDAVVAQATNAEQKLSEREAQALNAEIDAEISKALEAGKITPATKDYHKAQCQAEGGLERFKKFVEAAPVVADGSGISGDPPPRRQALNAEESAVSAMFGNSAEELDKHSPVHSGAIHSIRQVPPRPAARRGSQGPIDSRGVSGIRIPAAAGGHRSF